MRKRFWICLYIVVFCTMMLILSLVYPYVESYALAHRASSAPGGELLLWLVPFIAVIALDTAREWRKGSGEK